MGQRNRGGMRRAGGAGRGVRAGGMRAGRRPLGELSAPAPSGALQSEPTVRQLFSELEREGARLEREGTRLEAEARELAAREGLPGPTSRESGSTDFRRGANGSFSYSSTYEKVTVYSGAPAGPLPGVEGVGMGWGGVGVGLAGLWALGAATVATLHGETAFRSRSRWWMSLAWPFFSLADDGFREQFSSALRTFAGQLRKRRGGHGQPPGLPPSDGSPPREEP